MVCAPTVQTILTACIVLLVVMDQDNKHSSIIPSHHIVIKTNKKQRLQIFSNTQVQAFGSTKTSKVSTTQRLIAGGIEEHLKI
uniref:Type II peroxiredoxin n=1 Tax=Rhizophora mucronata TaxID=61149 RepID=A0A2P2JL19_RHIMU